MDYNNSSGYGNYREIPKELKKWNWGAFWLAWIWGIFNRTYIALLALLPIANFIMPFYLGAKGNELVWKNNSWISVEEIRLTQKKWAIAGWFIAIVMYLIMGIRIIDAYKIDKINASLTDKVMIELKKKRGCEKASRR